MRTSTFRTQQPVSVAEALNRLENELQRIGARDAVVSTNVETTRYGTPRSGLRDPDDPAVAVYFEIARKPICMPCDTYTRVADNIAAIAAHVEATRAVERHGVASVAEMFAGFAQLEAPGARKWWDVLQCRPDASRDVIAAQFRRLASDRHPDRPNGSHEAMAELSAARDAAMRERAA